MKGNINETILQLNQMNYKYTFFNNLHIVVIEDVEFTTFVNGRVFKEFLSEKYPEADGIFLIAYKDADNIYSLLSSFPMINGDILNEIPEEEWVNEVWVE